MHETCKEALGHKLEYVKSLAWQGLLSQLRKDIERENNGPMIITMWKHDIVPFANKGSGEFGPSTIRPSGIFGEFGLLVGEFGLLVGEFGPQLENSAN